MNTESEIKSPESQDTCDWLDLEGRIRLGLFAGYALCYAVWFIVCFVWLLGIRKRNVNSIVPDNIARFVSLDNPKSHIFDFEYSLLLRSILSVIQDFVQFSSTIFNIFLPVLAVYTLTKMVVSFEKLIVPRMENDTSKETFVVTTLCLIVINIPAALSIQIPGPVDLAKSSPATFYGIFDFACFTTGLSLSAIMFATFRAGSNIKFANHIRKETKDLAEQEMEFIHHLQSKRRHIKTNQD